MVYGIFKGELNILLIDLTNTVKYLLDTKWEYKSRDSKDEHNYLPTFM